MAELSAELRQKSGWHENYNNEDTKRAWVKAAHERGKREKNSIELSQKQVGTQSKSKRVFVTQINCSD